MGRAAERQKADGTVTEYRQYCSMPIGIIIYCTLLCWTKR